MSKMRTPHGRLPGTGPVALGKLGQERGASADVHQYGQRMVTDYSTSNQELMALTSAGTPPAGQHRTAPSRKPRAEFGGTGRLDGFGPFLARLHMPMPEPGLPPSRPPPAPRGPERDAPAVIDPPLPGEDLPRTEPDRSVPVPIQHARAGRVGA